MQGHHVVQNIATGGGKSFAQIAATQFAEGAPSNPMKTFTNANMLCPDPEKAGPAMIILPLVALEDQFGAEMKKLGIRF